MTLHDASEPRCSPCWKGDHDLCTGVACHCPVSHCRFATRNPHHVCVGNQGQPIHGSQECFYEARAQLFDEPPVNLGEKPDFYSGLFPSEQEAIDLAVQAREEAHERWIRQL